jgi:Cullin protein neddylation domain
MIIFMLYNEADAFTVQQLTDRIEIPIQWLERMLIPLIAAKVLKRQKQDLEEFAETEVIAINPLFQSKAKKLALLPAKKYETKRTQSAHQQEELKQIEYARQIVVEGIVIRLMKCHKRMTHSTLIADVLKSITIFKASSLMVKARIDNLIYREYLKRDENRMDIYEYVS